MSKRIGRHACVWLSLVAGVLGVVLGADARAATWVLGSGTGKPGEELQLTIVLRGDGVTSAPDLSVVVGPARITIDQPAGELTETAREGRCGWNGSDRIAALVFSGDTRPLPEEDLVVCDMHVRIRPTAAPGRVVVRANAAHCASGAGEGEKCEVIEGAIRILGTAAAPAPPLPESTTVVVLLEPDAPTVDSILAIGAEHSPVEGFRAVPPLSMRALIEAREHATGRFLPRLVRTLDISSSLRQPRRSRQASWRAGTGTAPFTAATPLMV